MTPPPPGPAVAVKAVAGDAQEGVVATELPAALVVRVVDAAGRGVPGQSVAFVVTGGGGHVYAGAAVTNAEGLAQERWTLGTSSAATQTLEARAVDGTTGQKLLFATFTAVAKPGPVATFTLVSGSGQQAPVGSALSQPIIVSARDAYGNAVAGASVAWTPAAGSGSMNPTTSAVGTDGRAQTVWTLGTTEGTQTATAQLAGKSIPLTAVGGPAVRWQRMDSQTSNALRAVWGTSASDVWAVGDNGTIVHFDGTRWAVQASGTTANLSRVWGVSPTEIYALGSASTLLRYDGASWQRAAFPAPLTAAKALVYVVSPTMAIAAVNNDNSLQSGDSIMRWNGSTWTTELRQAGPVGAVWMDASGRALAGTNTSSIGGASYDGTGWTRNFGFRTVSLSGTSWDDVWHTRGSNGSAGFVEHMHGGRTIDFTAQDLNAFPSPGWLVSPGEVYYFSHSGSAGPEGEVMRSAGSGTTPVDESIRGLAMWGAPSSQLFVVGSGGAIYRNTR